VFVREIEAGLVLSHPRDGRRVVVAPVEGGMLASVAASDAADQRPDDDSEMAWAYFAEALRPLAGSDLPARVAVTVDVPAPQGGLWRDAAGGIPVWSVLSTGLLRHEDAAIRCADAVTKELKPFPLDAPTRRSFLPGGDIASVAGEEAAARAEGLEPPVACWLVRRYGGEWRQVAESPGGLEAVGPGSVPVRGEIAWAVEREELRTLSSLLARWRLPEIAPDAESLRAISAAAESALARLLDWSPARCEREHARWEEDRQIVWARPPATPGG